MATLFWIKVPGTGFSYYRVEAESEERALELFHKEISVHDRDEITEEDNESAEVIPSTEETIPR